MIELQEFEKHLQIAYKKGKKVKPSIAPKSERDIIYYKGKYRNHILATLKSGACISLSYGKTEWEKSGNMVAESLYTKSITAGEASDFYKDNPPNMALLDELDKQIARVNAYQDLRAEYLKESGYEENLLDNGNRWYGGKVSADNLIFGAREAYGYGVMLYSDGSVYVGNLKESMHEAPGVLYYPNGQRHFEYEQTYGDTARGVKYLQENAKDSVSDRVKNGTSGSAKGEAKDKTKGGKKGSQRITKYKGSFHKIGNKHHTPHGSAIYEYALDKSGNEIVVYFGSFEKGLRQGQGIEHMADGSDYKGSFHMGRRHGSGKIHFANGEIESVRYIMGTLESEQNLVQDGTTTLYFADGSKYEGEVKGGKRSGVGVLFSKYGVKVYEGEWLDDKSHGQGKAYFDKDPDDKDRSYRNQTIVGGLAYDGQFKNGKRDGKGKLYFSNSGQLYYYGEFKNGHRHGKGTTYSYMGRGYNCETVGNWVKGRMHGEFIQTQERGKKDILVYDDGTYISRREHPDSKIDYSQIIIDLTKRADSGDIEAMKELGSLYGGGFLGKKDYAKYIAFYSRAADLGSHSAERAITNLALSRKSEEDIAEYLTNAYPYIKTKAEEGHTRSIFRLAICYENGFGTKPNYKKAIELYEKAALDRGQKASAEYLLARMYKDGKFGESGKVDKWDEWWEAAESDFKVAESAIKASKTKGISEQDKQMHITAAKTYYKKAVNKGLEKALKPLLELGEEYQLYTLPVLWCASRVAI
ncbi:MAG: hypothetical protein FWB72_05520 [Firmicutes bacterium]|nr:hypothetical protein [Bacillota bacterium]